MQRHTKLHKHSITNIECIKNTFPLFSLHNKLVLRSETFWMDFSPFPFKLRVRKFKTFHYAVFTSDSPGLYICIVTFWRRLLKLDMQWLFIGIDISELFNPTSDSRGIEIQIRTGSMICFFFWPLVPKVACCLMFHD